MKPGKDDYWDIVQQLRDLLDQSIREGPLPKLLRAENQVITPDIASAASELKEIILRADRDALRALHYEAVGGFDRSEESVDIPELEDARKKAEQALRRGRDEKRQNEEPA